MCAVEKIKNSLIVSCQALEYEPLYSSYIMSKMALAAKQGGAVGIRANSIKDIQAIKEEVDLPIIGIIKKDFDDSKVMITPTLSEIDKLYQEGVDIIAFDATERLRPNGQTFEQFIKEVKNKYPKQQFMADVSNLEEARTAYESGIDLIATTLVGYTDYTEGNDPLEELKTIVEGVPTRIIAEGNISTPKKAKRALNLGAYAVVVGSAITRPKQITEGFIKTIQS